jgi:hypothetical protein
MKKPLEARGAATRTGYSSARPVTKKALEASHATMLRPHGAQREPVTSYRRRTGPAARRVQQAGLPRRPLTTGRPAPAGTPRPLGPPAEPASRPHAPCAARYSPSPAPPSPTTLAPFPPRGHGQTGTTAGTLVRAGLSAGPATGQKTIAVRPSRSTRSSQCQATARESTVRSMSAPRRASSAALSRCDTRTTSCSIIGPSSRSTVA